MKDFVPELGQMCFGSAFDEYDCPEYVIAGLQYLFGELERVMWNNNQERYIAGEQHYKNDIFEIHPYWWGNCTCGQIELENKWCEENKHSEDCYQTKLKEIEKHWAEQTGKLDEFNQFNYFSDASLNKKDKKIFDKDVETLCKNMNLPYPNGWGIHCSCDYNKKYHEFWKQNPHKSDCKFILPNFKCGDFEVRWYKYPFRSTSCNKIITANEFAEIMDKCLKAVREEEKELYE